MSAAGESPQQAASAPGTLRVFGLLSELLRRMAPLLRPEKPRLLLGLFFVVLSSGTTLIYPQAIRTIVDEALGDGDMARVNTWALLIVAILAIEGVAIFFRSYLMNMGGRRVAARLRRDLHWNLLIQDVAFYDENDVGELTARINNDAGSFLALVSTVIPEALRMVIYGIGGVSLMFWISPWMALVVLGTGPVLGFTAARLGARMNRLARTVQDTYADTARMALESLQGIRTVRAHAQERNEWRRYSDGIARTIEAMRENMRTAAALQAVNGFLSELAVPLSIWLGSILVLGGLLEVGALVSFILYAGIVVRAVRNLSGFTGDLLQAHGATARVFELLERTPRMPTEGGARPSHAAGPGRVALEGVHFRYGTRSEAALRGVDLAVEPGEFVALVGSSGSGKSTAVSLMARFYDPNEGRVTLDGEDLRELDPSALRHRVTLVTQDSSLFARSVEENIRFGNEEATPAEVEAASRAAAAAEFIEAMPGGYEAPLGDRAVSISGGQRQRLAIARALLGRPGVLLLDEATSALDSETEQRVKDAIRKLPERPTVVLVAHRLSSVADVDRVVMMAEGRVVANGTHAELLQRSDAYRALVKEQLVPE